MGSKVTPLRQAIERTLSELDEDPEYFKNRTRPRPTVVPPDFWVRFGLMNDWTLTEVYAWQLWRQGGLSPLQAWRRATSREVQAELEEFRILGERFRCGKFHDNSTAGVRCSRVHGHDGPHEYEAPPVRDRRIEDSAFRNPALEKPPF